MGNVTNILGQGESRDGQVVDKRLPLRCDEFRKLAPARITEEEPWNTLQAMALVHEACIRLANVDKAQHCNSWGRLFQATAKAMKADSREREYVAIAGDRTDEGTIGSILITAIWRVKCRLKVLSR